MVDERGRVQALLENLRIEADVLVFWLACGDLPSYEIIVNGKSHNKQYEDEVEECLKDREWWDEIQKMRGMRGGTLASEDLAAISPNNWPDASFQHGRKGERAERFHGLRRLLRKSKRRHSVSDLTGLGVNLSMRTHRLLPNVVNQWSEDTGSDSDNSKSSGADEDEEQSAASEGDIDDFVSDSDSGVKESYVSLPCVCISIQSILYR